ncbi:hypothetical protein [Sphingomonas sp. PAMC 26621]|uniref:hypothetical protein n=1 Tax=Sphingomonas sp. PAMC 26621 TaxID=1112213 RepID=UPI00111130D1|nr:hypothetical protein [Sphingomonas sp. PAMC 26621]
MAFDLLASPFARLNVSTRATRAELVEAHQRAVLDGEHDESDLDRALAALTAPRERLRAELSFLPGSTPAQARAMLERLKTTPFTGSWGEGWDGANVIAHLLSNGEKTANVVALLVKTHTPDVVGIERKINEARQISGFPPIPSGILAAEVGSLVTAHADTAAERLSKRDGGYEEATAVVEFGLQDEGLRPFLSAFVEAFARHTAPHLARLSADLEASSSRLRSARTVANAEALAACLHRWDTVRQPVQLWDEAQGIDEPDSRALGGKLRDLYIELANEHSAYEVALVISRALHEAFGELPGMRDLFAEDTGTLDELAGQARLTAIMAPVVDALTTMAIKPTVTAINLDAWIGSPVRKDPGKLRAVFETALDKLRGEDTGIPAMNIRSLTLDLHNEHTLSDAALRLTRWLLSYRARLPGSVVAKLLDDQTTLQRIVWQNELKSNLDRGDLNQAETLVGNLLGTATDAEDRELMRSVRADIVSRRGSRSRGRWGWGIAAAFVALIIFLENSGQKPAYVDTHTYATTSAETAPPAAEVMDTSSANSSADVMTPPAMQTTDLSAPAAVGNSDTKEETPPLSLAGQSFSMPELRYCRRQKERLRAASIAVDNSVVSEVDGFNAAVDEFNGKCSDFTYLQSDMTTVTSEVEADAATLADEGRSMVQRWK